MTTQYFQDNIFKINSGEIEIQQYQLDMEGYYSEISPVIVGFKPFLLKSINSQLKRLTDELK